MGLMYIVVDLRQASVSSNPSVSTAVYLPDNGSTKASRDRESQIRRPNMGGLGSTKERISYAPLQCITKRLSRSLVHFESFSGDTNVTRVSMTS